MKALKRLKENYEKPTPPYWRKIGDIALFLIPVIELQLETLPIEIDPMFKWAITTFLVIFKAWTNTKTDKNIYEG